MWDRAGDKGRARALYQQAIGKLPGYAHAVAHLAALLPTAQAVALLSPVAKSANDPEYAAMLAVLMNQERPGAGTQLLKGATAGYTQLLKRHPAAFADTRAGFTSDMLKDADKAVEEIAEENVKAREVPEAYELLVAAQLGANAAIKACASAEKGLALKYPSLSLKAVAAKAFEQCGRKDRATALRKGLETRQPARGRH